MLENSGERIIPDLMKPTNGMLLEHVARYYFATPYVKGKVLDIACGTGYGTQMIAKLCKNKAEVVVGADKDAKALTYAKGRYHHPLIRWAEADAENAELPSALGTFTTIVSFETIEHLHDDRRFLRNLHAMLEPGGTLVLSTPFGRGRGRPTNEPFHVHQLTPDEFRALFGSFRDVDFFYQRGVTFEPRQRDGIRYPFGIAVARK
ncbi:MAG TPA: class I SAM-dependent methyltransferase [Bacillales bacterium]|nr:class I SAM-dependent methyltransferase [Bacillales bacterium]